MAQMRVTATIMRETGMALAVLALWMLVLLAPLHQTAGLLRDLADKGHALPAGFSLCVTLAADKDAGKGDGSARAAVPCPVQALAKAAVPSPVVLVLAAPLPGEGLLLRPAPLHLRALPQAPPLPGQPRAPPALI